MGIHLFGCPNPVSIQSCTVPPLRPAAMDKPTRSAIEKATQCARRLLEEDFTLQLEGTYDVLRSGVVAASGGPHLSARQRLPAGQDRRCDRAQARRGHEGYGRRSRTTSAMRRSRRSTASSRSRCWRRASWCRSASRRASSRPATGSSAGWRPAWPLLPDGAGYRLYIESLFDELSTEVKVLFDRRDPASVLWPKRAAFEALLEILNASGAARGLGRGRDDRLGLPVLQRPRSGARCAKRVQAPRNSRELAVRNQFFTPRYVVQFLTDNTLGRIWYEMREGADAARGASASTWCAGRRTGTRRALKKDPRDLRILDPACGSGHFLLYAFDLLLVIYEEGWEDVAAPRAEATGRTLRARIPGSGGAATASCRSSSCVTTCTGWTSIRAVHRSHSSRYGCARSGRSGTSASRAPSAP